MLRSVTAIPAAMEVHVWKVLACTSASVHQGMLEMTVARVSKNLFPVLGWRGSDKKEAWVIGIS